MKIVNIELCEWFYPYVNGLHWPTPYRTEVGIVFDGINCFDAFTEHTLVFINCGGPADYWPEFWGKLKFLEQYYQPKQLVSYDEAKQHTDRFLEQMSNLIAFI